MEAVRAEAKKQTIISVRCCACSRSATASGQLNSAPARENFG